MRPVKCVLNRFLPRYFDGTIFMIKNLLAVTIFSAFAGSAMAIDLPPEIAKQGSIKVAIVPNYPPMEFRDPATSTLTGFDVELGEALGRKLGIKIAWQETSFDQMMPAIATGRVDAILSGMTDMASRQDTATFVDYLAQRTAFLRPAIARGGVQGYGGAVRKERRRQPPHLLSEEHRRLERCELRRQSDQVRRHRRIRRCPDPAQAGTARCGRAGRRDASLHHGSRAEHLCSGRRGL